MDNGYTNLKHLYIRLSEDNDVELMKTWAKDYYKHQMMSKKHMIFG